MQAAKGDERGEKQEPAGPPYQTIDPAQSGTASTDRTMCCVMHGRERQVDPEGVEDQALKVTELPLDHGDTGEAKPPKANHREEERRPSKATSQIPTGVSPLCHGVSGTRSLESFPRTMEKIIKEPGDISMGLIGVGENQTKHLGAVDSGVVHQG